MRTFACALMLSALRAGAAVPIDLSAVKQGSVAVDSGPTSLTVRWKDEAGHPWTAEFSLDPKAPLLTAIAMNGAPVITRARPFLQCTTGKRRGGWDQILDFPPSPTQGKRSYVNLSVMKIARVV